MRKMKKYFLCLFALLILFSAFIVSVNAHEAKDTTKTDNYNSIVFETRKPYSTGDLNGDTKITATDARICLRAAAKLYKLTDEQIAAADVFHDGSFSAENARYILRISAKLGYLIYDEKEINVGDELKTSGLFTAGSGRYIWKYTIPNDTFDVAYELNQKDEYDENGDLIIGNNAEEIFTFKALKSGSYIIHFEQKNNAENESIADFYIRVIVHD